MSRQESDVKKVVLAALHMIDRCTTFTAFLPNKGLSFVHCSEFAKVEDKVQR